VFFHEYRFCPPPCSIRIVGCCAAEAASRFPLVAHQRQVLIAAELDGA
jgi:hypothetical protein